LTGGGVCVPLNLVRVNTNKNNMTNERTKQPYRNILITYDGKEVAWKTAAELQELQRTHHINSVMIDGKVTYFDKDNANLNNTVSSLDS